LDYLNLKTRKQQPDHMEEYCGLSHAKNIFEKEGLLEERKNVIMDYQILKGNEGWRRSVRK